MKDLYKLHKKDKVVILTGAGISAESGIKTFRENNGLWEQHKIEEVATPEAYEKNPELVTRFYKARYEGLQTAMPNAAHTAISFLEQQIGDNFTLITQNVDNLHKKAGSQNILAMHGELTKGRCTNCEHIYDNYDHSYQEAICPSCNQLAAIRPNIVWFGEMPLHLEKINALIEEANLFIAIGTSGAVYPAAQFVNLASMSGAVTILINTDPPENSSSFEHHIYGKATKMVPELVNSMIKSLKRQ